VTCLLQNGRTIGRSGAAQPRPGSSCGTLSCSRRGHGAPACARRRTRRTWAPSLAARNGGSGRRRRRPGRSQPRPLRRRGRICPDRHGARASGRARRLVAAGGSERGHRARPDPDRRGRSRLGSRAADLRQAKHAASGAVPGNPRRGGGDGVACAPRPRRGGHGHRRRAGRCRVRAGDARPRRLRLGRARPQRSRLECPRAAHRRLPDRCCESPGVGIQITRRRPGTSRADRCSRGRRADGAAVPASRSCSPPIRVCGSRATAAA
jgi:hypothetical protein